MRTLDSVTEAILLREAERRALSYGEDGARVRALAAAASARVAASKRLTAPSMDPVVATLLRDAIVLRLQAAEAAHAAVPELPDTVRATLEEPNRGSFDLAAEADLRQAIDALKRAERDVRAAVESRSPAYIRGARFGRMAAIALAAAWALFSIGHALSSPPNLAFHKAVTSDGAGALGDLVDGETDTLKPLVLHATFVTIDLGGPFAIRSVRIYNRQDRSFDASLPLTLETSLDGTSWITHVRRRDHFSIWNEKLGDTRARYVRLRSDVHVIALNEIEIFGWFAR
jgi:hypothetical protein